MSRRLITQVLTLSALVASALVLGHHRAQAASVTSLYSTGITAQGTLAANGSTDLHYSLVSAPGGTAAIADMTSAGVYPYDGTYVADDGRSTWLSVQSADGMGAAGTYVYQTTFDLTGFSAATAVITGEFAADNDAEIFLNGVDTGVGTSSYVNWANVAIGSGFIAGINTITFVVDNTTSAPSPTGLRTELAATASKTLADTPVPEPASLPLLMAGLAGIRLLRRKPVE